MLEYSVTISTLRTKAEAISDNVFPYIRLLQQSHAKNVANASRVSQEYLTVHLYNSLLVDIEKLLQRKLVTTTGSKLKLKLSVGHAVALYRTFLILPIDKNNFYLDMVRNEWVEELDKQLFSPGILLPLFN